MWSILPKDELDNFLNSYNALRNYNNEFILHENEKYYILPRYFVDKYPFHKLYTLEDKTFNEEIIDITFTGSLREHQVDPMRFFIDLYNNTGSLSGIFKAKCGFGKCLGPDTGILLFDCSIKKAKDIIVGDKLMGPDSKPRTVTSTMTGFGELYNIIPRKGKEFICNDEHILNLKHSRRKDDNKLYNFTINEYLHLSDSLKSCFSLWKPTGLNFKEKELKIDPYVLGLYISDGSIGDPKITFGKDDIESMDYLIKYISTFDDLKISEYKENNSIKLYISGFNRKNWVWDYLKNNCINNKEKIIPSDYLYNSEENRLKLLAGILEGDSFFREKENAYVLNLKDKNLIKQIEFLSKSLGFSTTYKPILRRISRYNKEIREYYHLSISGDTSKIPCVLPRKKAIKKRYFKLYSKFKVESIGEGRYYGFTLLEDPLFLLEDFTVTHNTVSTTYLASKLNKKTLIVVDNDELRKQWVEAFINMTDLTIDDIGLIQGPRMDLDKPVCIAMVQTLMSKVKTDLKGNYEKIKNAGYGFVIFDEAHSTSAAPKFATSSLLINTRNIFSLTATPFSQGIGQVLLKTTMGEVIYEYADYDIIPEINFIHFSSKINKKQIYRFNMISNDYVKSISYYNSIIYDDPEYLSTINRITTGLITKGHYVLILVSTIKQLEAIVDYLKSNGLSPIPFYSAEKELNKETDNLLVATNKFVSKGFDHPRLSALIYANPLKGRVSLIQTAGRILRSREGKLSPEIFDLVDDNFGKTFSSTIQTKKNVFLEEFGEKLKFNEI